MKKNKNTGILWFDCTFEKSRFFFSFCLFIFIEKGAIPVEPSFQLQIIIMQYDILVFLLFSTLFHCFLCSSVRFSLQFFIRHSRYVLCVLWPLILWAQQNSELYAIAFHNGKLRRVDLHFWLLLWRMRNATKWQMPSQTRDLKRLETAIDRIVQ